MSVSYLIWLSCTERTNLLDSIGKWVVTQGGLFLDLFFIQFKKLQ